MKPGIQRARGFTLIELLVAVVIAGILMAIAIPNYSRYAARGHRTEAQAVLLDIVQREQQFLLDARTYTSSLSALNGYTVPSNVATFYTIRVDITAGPPPTFTAFATPITGTAQAADGVLSITHTGIKSPSDKW